MELVIEVDDPRVEDVRALLDTHLAFSRDLYPAEHVHALDIDGLLDAAVMFFSARVDGAVVGVGALKHIDKGHAEIKSMHTSERVRGQGVGRAMVDHLLAVAAERGHERVSLETGTIDAFEPARTLYEKVGFRQCEPFSEYWSNPYSVCMTIELDS